MENNTAEAVRLVYTYKKNKQLTLLL